MYVHVRKLFDKGKVHGKTHIHGYIIIYKTNAAFQIHVWCDHA